MTRLGDFSKETLAVDAISADIGLLEKLAERGGTLCEADLRLLLQCNARLLKVLPVLSANAAPSQFSPPASKIPGSPAVNPSGVKTIRTAPSPIKRHVNAA